MEEVDEEKNKIKCRHKSFDHKSARMSLPPPHPPTNILIYNAVILEQSMGARNQVGIGLPYWAATLNRLAESIPGLLKSLKCSTRARIYKRLRSPGIDSKVSIPPAYIACRACTITLFIIYYPPGYISWRNRFLEMDSWDP
jgi:hypothetical protein